MIYLHYDPENYPNEFEDAVFFDNNLIYKGLQYKQCFPTTCEESEILLTFIGPFGKSYYKLGEQKYTNNPTEFTTIYAKDGLTAVTFNGFFIGEFNPLGVSIYLFLIGYSTFPNISELPTKEDNLIIEDLILDDMTTQFDTVYSKINSIINDTIDYFYQDYYEIEDKNNQDFFISRGLKNQQYFFTDKDYIDKDGYTVTEIYFYKLKEITFSIKPYLAHMSYQTDSAIIKYPVCFKILRLKRKITNCCLKAKCDPTYFFIK